MALVLRAWELFESWAVFTQLCIGSVGFIGKKADYLMGKVGRAAVVGVEFALGLVLLTGFGFEGQYCRNFKSVCTSMPIKVLLNDAVMLA